MYKKVTCDARAVVVLLIKPIVLLFSILVTIAIAIAKAPL